MSRDAREAARSFDPVALARLESAAWIGYYRREWFRVLAASVGLVRCGFALSWPKTLWGAWLVLRANQRWAPYPDNADGCDLSDSRVVGMRRSLLRSYRSLRAAVA